MLWKTSVCGLLRGAGAPQCLRVDLRRAQLSRGFFDQAEERGIFVDPVPAEAQCTWCKSRTMRDVFA